MNSVLLLCVSVKSWTKNVFFYIITVLLGRFSFMGVSVLQFIVSSIKPLCGVCCCWHFDVRELICLAALSTYLCCCDCSLGVSKDNYRTQVRNPKFLQEWGSSVSRCKDLTSLLCKQLLLFSPFFWLLPSFESITCKSLFSFK